MGRNRTVYESGNRTTAGRSGFSLLEILMVLAVFVMISGLAMPSLHRAYTGQQLRSAADVVRARFAQARVKSIESGDVYGFFYSPGNGDYYVAPMSQGFQSIRNGINPAANNATLKNNIVFAVGHTVEDSRSVEATSQSTQTFGSMRPVLFYPDGTSQDAVVLMQSQKTGAMIQVDLRGLTGTSTKSGILDPAEIRQ